MEKSYSLIKEYNSYEVINISTPKKKGYKFKPKNNDNYNGININEITVINPSFIEKLLKKKVKRKLDSYLNLVVNVIDDDNDEDGSKIEKALNDITRYKEILLYRYRKFLNERYFSLLYQKMELLERELKTKYLKLNSKEEKKDNNNLKTQTKENEKNRQDFNFYQKEETKGRKR